MPYQNESKNTDLLSTFTNLFLDPYETAYYVGLDDRSVKTYKWSDLLGDEYLPGDDYVKALEKFILDYVLPNDQPALLEAMQPDYIRGKLASRTEFSETFSLRSHDRTEKIYRFQVIRGEDEKHAVIAFRNITSDVVAERERQKDMQNVMERQKARLDQVKGLAAQFSVLYFVDLDTMDTENYYLAEQATPNQAKDIDQKSENFFEAFKSSMLVYAHPDFKDKMLKYADPAYMKSILKNTRRHEFRFLCMDATGAYSWTDMVLMKFSDHEDDEPVNIAVGYYNTDAEMKERLETSRRQQRDLDAIRGLADEYDTLYFVDLTDDAYSLYYLTQDSPDVAKQMADEKQKFSIFHKDSMHTFCHQDDMAEMLKFANLDYIRTCLKDRPKYTQRFLCNSNNGYKWCSFALIRLDKEDPVQRVAVGYTNIHEQVEKELAQQKSLTDALVAAEAANHAKTSFLNNMSHDIRTPMNAILGYTQLASSHIDDQELIKDYLAKISESSNHLLSLINDVLDMSRIESGKMTLDEKAEDITAIMNTLRNLVQNDVDAKELRFTVDLNGIKDKYVFCDKLRLTQALLNILTNAVKYTDERGAISLRVKENISRNGYGTYEFRIKDNGIGMSKDFLERIYEPFERAKSSTSSGISGTGLGMAITKNLIDMMGGSVEIISAPNEGTEVIVNIDLRLTNASAVLNATDSDDSALANDSAFKGKKILLVEDNEINREIAIEILSECGMIVDTAEDGDVAVNRLMLAQPGDYDLVLMDIQMPRMNGYEATKLIRSLYSDISKIPILAMTANAFEEDRQAALKAGMNAHIAKPIKIEELKSTLAKFL